MFGRRPSVYQNQQNPPQQSNKQKTYATHPNRNQKTKQPPKEPWDREPKSNPSPQNKKAN
jgi:hypothetical protein